MIIAEKIIKKEIDKERVANIIKRFGKKSCQDDNNLESY